jgi:long-chain fatty acid transport protein
MKKLFTTVGVLAAAGTVSTAHASGFQIDTQAARGTGMASAMAASVDDSSAIFYNPAGLAQGQKLDLQVGVALILPLYSYTPPSGGTSTSAKTQVTPLPQLYASYGFTDNLTLGLGIFNEYGLGLGWPDGWTGATQITNVLLTAININPSVGFKIGDRAKVGIGVQIVRGSVSLQKDVSFVDSTGSLELAGTGVGAGGNVGVMFDILPKQLTFGASYRSAVNIPLDGKAHFSNVPTEFQTQLKDQGVHTEVTLPDTVALGLAYRPLEGLLIDVDATYTAWQRYNALTINFDDSALNQSQPKHWKYTWNFRAGAEYQVLPALKVRAGLLFDPSPAPSNTASPDLPDSTRVNVALGAGYTLKRFQFDLGYQLVIFSGTTSTNPVFLGKYSGLVNVLGLTASVHWDTNELFDAPPPAQVAPAAAGPAM